MVTLDAIIAHKHQELATKKPDGGRFAQTFASKDARIIAEVKLASPSYNLQSIDPQSLIEQYGTNPEISAFSLLIDQKFFAGNITRIQMTTPYHKPVLFKEFVIDARQIDGAAYYGYDAVLLLARVLTDEQLQRFARYCHVKNIFAMIEIDNDRDLERILPFVQQTSLTGIGINARDLGTMQMRPGIHHSIQKKYQADLDGCLCFAFSGIAGLDERSSYQGLFNGILIGTALIKPL